jgi:hypothetical protein
VSSDARSLRIATLLSPAFIAISLGFAISAAPPTRVVALVAGGFAALYCLTNASRTVIVLIPVALLVPAFLAVHLRSLPDQTPVRALVCLGCLALVASLGQSAKRLVLPRAVRAIAIVYCVFLALAFVWHPSTATLRGSIALGVGAFVPALLVLWSVTSARRAWALAAVLVCVLDVAALLGIFEEVRGVHLFGAHAGTFFHADGRSGWLRAQGIFPHPIVLGTALALTLPFAFACLLSSDGRLRWLGRVSIPVHAAGLVVTVSRGPWIGAIVGVVVVAFLLRRRFVRQALALLAVVIALLLTPASATVGAALSSLWHPTDRREAYVVDYRKELLRQTVAEVRKHPFAAHLALNDQLLLEGTVGGNAVNLATSTDNTYAYYLLRLGVPGAALLVLLLIAIPLASWRRLPSADSNLRPIAAAAIAAEVVLLVVGATVATLSWEQLGVAYWMITGLGLAACRLDGEAKHAI